MKLLDLEELRFTQAQVLEMVPSLPAKTLQNWNARGILQQEAPAPGRQGKRLYSAAGVVALRFLVGATELGIAPADAATMVQTVLGHALALHEVYPALTTKAGRPYFEVLASSPHLYSRGTIFKGQDGYTILISNKGFESIRIYSPKFYIVAEVDYIIIGALNAVYQCVFGDMKDDALPEVTPEQYDAMEAALSKFNPSGDPA